MGLSLLFNSGLPMKHWDDAFTTSVYLINRLPTKAIQFVSPLEKLFNHKPDYNSLKVFGCLCYPFVRPYNKHKLQPQSATGTFLGYSIHHKGYKVLLPSGKIVVTRDILFDETLFPHKHHVSPPVSVGATPLPAASWGFTPSPLPITSPSSMVSPTQSIPSPSIPYSAPISPVPSPHPNHSSSTSPILHSPLSPSQVSIPSSSSLSSPLSVESNVNAEPSPPRVTSNAHPMITKGKTGIFKPKVFLSPTADDKFMNIEPQTVSEAISSPLWRAAMVRELRALFKNHTWTLTPQPAGKNSIGCKWVFKIKRHANGSIARYKARLVAQGFTQEPGFDFKETFSPVVKPSTIRLILSLAVQQNWGVTHLDVDNAFLNGALDETIYMQQPPGFEVGGPVPLVCKLNKVIYGLKQASRSWFLTFRSVLLNMGFLQSKADHSLLYKKGAQATVYLLVYVDDILVTGSSSFGIQSVIGSLSKVFFLKNLDLVHHFLGIEISQTSTGLNLH